MRACYTRDAQIPAARNQTGPRASSHKVIAVQKSISRHRWIPALVLLVHVASAATPGTLEIEVVLDRKVPELLREYAVPGAAIGVIRQQHVVALRGFGFAHLAPRTAVTPDTSFNVGSISKTLTAWGLMRLVEQGKVDLDRPIGAYIKRWRLPASSFDSSAVTFARVLSHTAGISAHGYDGVDVSQPRAGVLDLLNGKGGVGTATLTLSPGTAFQYSGANYLIVQVAIEDLTGQAFTEYMSREVFRPLRMHGSRFELPADNAAFARAYDAFENPLPRLRYDALPAAGLTTNVRDLARFAAAAFPSHRGRGALRSATLERMQTAASHSVWTEHDPYGPSPAYGLGFTVRPEQLLGHTGIGHGGSNLGWESFFEIVPATGDGIVILTNGANGTAVIAAVLCEWRLSASQSATCPTIDARIPLLAQYRAAGIDAVFSLYESLRAQPQRYDLSVSQLNSLGYQLLRAGDVPGAVRVFERNRAAFPAQWNVYDSLAEALAQAGDRGGSIANYRRSLQLNPYNENGRRMLEQLDAPPN